MLPPWWRRRASVAMPYCAREYYACAFLISILLLIATAILLVIFGVHCSDCTNSGGTRANCARKHIGYVAGAIACCLLGALVGGFSLALFRLDLKEERNDAKRHPHRCKKESRHKAGRRSHLQEEACSQQSAQAASKPADQTGTKPPETA